MESNKRKDNMNRCVATSSTPKLVGDATINTLIRNSDNNNPGCVGVGIINIGKGVPETSYVLESALRQLDVAIELLPLSSREAYAEARRRCPHLIATESNPIIWIRHEEFNIWAAARRLVRYWEYRKEIFLDRAFSPILDVSGDTGALDREGVDAIERGIIVKLPSFQPDSETGERRHVFFSDRSRRHGNTDWPIQKSLRLTFYVFNRAICEGSATDPVTHNFQVIDLLEFMPRHKVGFAVMTMSREAFPAKVEPIILAVPYTKKRTYFQELFPILVKRLGQSFLIDRVVVEIGESKLDLQRKLEARNLRKDCLPQCVGGTWTYDKYDRWVEQEKRMIRTIQSKNDLCQPIRIGNDVETMKPVNDPYKYNKANECSESGSKSVKSRSSTENQLIVSDKETRAVRRQKFNEAMNRIPWTQKGVYMEAMERSPNLVNVESCPLHFLSYSKGNVTEAALRFAAYWRKRKELFGEVAFSPIVDWPNHFGK